METVVNNPLVSIVTPSYNQAEYLEQTICSVLAQDYSPIEYLVIDGGSTDGSLEIIKNHQSRIDYWVSEEDQGQTEAINKGFSNANGEIFAWLNSDDTYQPGAVGEAVNYLEQNPDTGLVYGDLNYIDDKGKVIGQFNARQATLRRLQRGAVNIPQPAAFWRSALWHRVGPLDPDCYFAMDYDLWLRLARITELVYLPGHTWANFRIHGKSKTIAADKRCWDEMLQIHLRDGGSPFSILGAKYWLRRILGPLWNRYKRWKLLD